MSLLKEQAAEEGQYVTKIHIDEKMERRAERRKWRCSRYEYVWGARGAVLPHFPHRQAGLPIIEVEGGPNH